MISWEEFEQVKTALNMACANVKIAKDGWQIALPKLLQGVGVAGFMIPLVTLSLSSVPSHLLPNASGIFNFIRLLFGAGIGTSCFITLFNSRVYHHEAYLTESIQPFNPNWSELLSPYMEYPSTMLYAFMRAFVDRESAVLALNDIFWACGWMFILLACLLMLCKPISSKKPSATPATH